MLRKNKVSKPFISALLFISTSLLGTAWSQTPTNNPEVFLFQYYAAKVKAKNPLATKNYFSASIRKKQDKLSKLPEDKTMPAGTAEMFEKLAESSHPKKIKIVKKESKPNKVSFELQAIDIPKAYQEQIKDSKSSSFKGSVVLLKEGSAWKVDKDMWTFTCTNENGSSEESSGICSDAEEAAASSSPPPTPVRQKGFEDQVMDKFLLALKKAPGSGQSIYAAMEIDTTGKIVKIQAKGESPQPAAEAQITNIIMSTNPFMPLPEQYKSQRNVWMTFSWGENGTSISGPYFQSNPLPSWLLEKVGQK